MKKKILLAGAVALMAVAAVTGYSGYGKSKVPDLLSANVEALAGGEITVHKPCIYASGICYILDDDLGYYEVPGYYFY